ncbi:hypothetical protein [Mycetocola sp. JXN-3]|uniref:hypothetical protein n=1 Tax=Mycetocola sp. JXN-3 TaxID=2116510 RepID=UPI00165D0680|nr:hypothetical protein [Mycetocola sp. JXN-3]
MNGSPRGPHDAAAERGTALTTMRTGIMGTIDRSPLNRTFILVPAIIGIVVLAAALAWYLISGPGSAEKKQAVELSTASISEPLAMEWPAELDTPQGAFSVRPVSPDTPGGGEFVLLASTLNHYAGFGIDHLRGAFIGADGTVFRDSTIAPFTGTVRLEAESTTPLLFTVETGGKTLGDGHLAFWMDDAPDAVVYFTVSP